MSNELSSVLTIPYTVAMHVLGDSEVQFAEGDLNLYLHSSHEGPVDLGQKDKLPIMTLSIGKAAFPLFRSTLFGTPPCVLALMLYLFSSGCYLFSSGLRPNASIVADSSSLIGGPYSG